MTETSSLAENPYVGTGNKKIAGETFVRGRARFVDDIKMPGMLHLAILRSPYAHALIRSIDISAAQNASGVVLVLTGSEARKHCDPIPHFIDPSVLGGKHADVFCLAIECVSYAGEPVVAVVAETKHDARAALPLIRIDYEVLPHVVELEEALKPGAPKVVETWEDNVLICGRFVNGDADDAFRKADHVYRDTLRLQRYSTQPLETRKYVAMIDPVDDTLTLHATAQNPHPFRNVLAAALRMSENQIRIIVPNLGGAFGMKMHGHPEEPLVCLLAKLTRRPVKWTEDREECLLVGGREQIHHYEVAFNDDGRVLGFRDSLLGNVGVPSALPGWGMVYLTALTLPCVYRIQNVEIQFSAVVTNKGPWNASRGYGKEASNLLMERIMDVVARKVGLDPVEVRLRNFIQPGDFPYKSPTGLIFDSGDYPAVLGKLLDRISYDRFRDEQNLARKDGRYLGIGIGCEVTPEGGAIPGTMVGGYDTSTVRIDPQGKVTVLTGVTTPGGGAETGIAAIVSDELGADIADVRVIQGDTQVCPYGFGNYSGRTTIVGGGSAALAAREVREKLAKMAAALLNVDPRDLFFNRSRIYTAGSPDPKLSFQQVAYTVYTHAYDVASVVEPSLEATRTYKPGHINHIPDAAGKVNPYPSFSNGAYAAVVEVDLETGVVKVLRTAVVHDCGTIINPPMVDGQCHGAVAMGIGAALSENLPYDGNGVPLTRSFKDYLMVRAADVPEISTGHHCTPNPYTMLGIKGAGEAGVGGAQAAVANAVADALAEFDMQIREMPLSPPRIWQIIQERRRRDASETRTLVR